MMVPLVIAEILKKTAVKTQMIRAGTFVVSRLVAPQREAAVAAIPQVPQLQTDPIYKDAYVTYYEPETGK